MAQNTIIKQVLASTEHLFRESYSASLNKSNEDEDRVELISIPDNTSRSGWIEEFDTILNMFSLHAVTLCRIERGYLASRDRRRHRQQKDANTNIANIARAHLFDVTDKTENIDSVMTETSSCDVGQKAMQGIMTCLRDMMRFIIYLRANRAKISESTKMNCSTAFQDAFLGFWENINAAYNR